MEVQKALKIRIYPRKDQIGLLENHFGASRFIYNYFLDLRKKEYLENKKSISYNNCSKILTGLKKQEEYSWLNEVDSTSLQQSIINLDAAYHKFFNKIACFPKFKSKKTARPSYRISMLAAVRIDWSKGLIKLPKFKIPFRFKGKLYDDLLKMNSITIFKTPTGKYYASIQGIFKINCRPKTKGSVGIDLGIKTFIVDSNGQEAENPRFLKRSLKKLKYLQRQHSKSKKGTSRRERKRKTLASQYEKVTNCRNDYLHKVSSRLIDENQVICIEDLAVKNMVKNRRLSQAISDVSWGRFISFLKYKAGWHDRTLVQIDRFFPSSKTCSSCGWINQELTLKHREWTCPSCGGKHDRDHNAAKNILKQGLNEWSGCELQSDPKQKPVEASSLEESVKQDGLQA